MYYFCKLDFIFYILENTKILGIPKPKSDFYLCLNHVYLLTSFV